MRLESYRIFYRSARRMRLLYDVTAHSYNLMYEDGRRRLRDPAQRDALVEIALTKQTVKRPLKVLTFHSKDVYPQLLRSTLLIRLVAMFEAFLIDTLEEVSERSDDTIDGDKVVEITQRQLLAIDQKQSLKSFLMQKTLRQLTSAGFREIKKFYRSKLGVEVAQANTSSKLLEEIHDRRHLYVHRAGHVDEQYVHKYPTSGFKVDELAPIDEGYFLAALGLISNAALQVKNQVEAKYPDAPTWCYKQGSQRLSGSDLLVVVTAKIISPDALSDLLDLSCPIDSSQIASDITIWVSTRSRDVRWLLSGSRLQISKLFKILTYHQNQGHISKLDSFKVNRDFSLALD